MNTPNDVNDREQVPALFTFVGTAFLPILKSFNILPKGVYIVIDAKSELDAIHLTNDADHEFIKLPLEPRIAQDFVEKVGSEAQIKTLAAIPNMSTQTGCGQARGIGDAAVKCIIDAINFTVLFLNRVLPALRRMGGGELKCVNHRHYSGGCGGMGSAGGISLVRAIQSLFSEPTDPEIESKIFLLGAVTFCAPQFQRTTENASCSLVEWLYLIRHPVSNRVSSILHLQDLPPLELDGITRNALFAGILCGDVRRRIR